MKSFRPSSRIPGYVPPVGEEEAPSTELWQGDRIIADSYVSYTPDAVAGTGIGKEVWLSMRTDNFAGSGTALDPFDVSSPSLLSDVWADIPIGATIHFVKGNAPFVANSTLTIKDHQIIRGHGSTVMAADNVVSGEDQVFTLFGSIYAGLLTRFEMHDLNIDLNSENQDGFMADGTHMEALAVYASNALVQNVEYTGAWANPGEGFPFHVHHGHAGNGEHPEDKIEFINCRSISNRGYCGGIGAFDQNTPVGPKYFGRIKDCLVYDNEEGVSIGVTGCKGAELSGNMVINSGPIMFDTWENDAMLIHDNWVFGGWSVGINFYSGHVNANLRIYNNHIESLHTCVYTLGKSGTTFYVYDNYLQTEEGYPVEVGGTLNKGAVYNNIVRPSALGLIPSYFGTYEGFRIWGNFDHEGNPYPLIENKKYVQETLKNYAVFTDGLGTLQTAGKITLGQVSSYESKIGTYEVFIRGNNAWRTGRFDLYAHNGVVDPAVDTSWIKWYLHPGHTLEGNGEIGIYAKHLGSNTVAIFLKYEGALTDGDIFVNQVSGRCLDQTVGTFTGSTEIPMTGTLDAPVTKAKFSARASSAFGQVIPTLTPTKITFDLEDYDTTGSYNVSTSTFTAPRTGYYTLQFSVFLQTANAEYTELRIYKNGSPFIEKIAHSKNTAVAEALEGVRQVPLTAGDTITIYAYHNKGSDLTIDVAHAHAFTGWEE